MLEHEEGGAGTGLIAHRVVRCGARGGMGTEEIGEPDQAVGMGPRSGPFDEVGEIDVGGEVLAAGVLIDGGAFEALVEEVGAERAGRAAVVEGVGRGSVVDGEEFPGAPRWHPSGEPLVIGSVDLDALAGRVIDLPDG